MKILVTGNKGYIGPVVVKHLRNSYPEAIILGLDMGTLLIVLLPNLFCQNVRWMQYFIDVRQIPKEMLEVLMPLCWLPYPMIYGNRFEEVTLDVNHRSSVELTKPRKQVS